MSDEAQLSFQVTKHWDRPEGQAGWTEMTCSKAPFRRVLEWMLEEFPEGSVRIGHNTMVFQDGTEQICINWPAVPEGIRAPVIRPQQPDENVAALARVREIAARWAAYSAHGQLSEREIAMIECGELLTAVIRGDVPEPAEPALCVIMPYGIEHHGHGPEIDCPLRPS